MARAGTAWISIRGDFGPLRAGLVNAEKSYGKQLNSMQSRLKQGFKTAAKLAGVGLAAGAAVGAKKAFREFEDAEKASRQTEAVLRSTGSAANVSAKQIEALASSLSQKAAIDDEAIQAAENLLLTFTSVRNEVGKGNDIFNQATGVITDMSVALGQDLKGTTIQVGKALQDPIKGLTALRRVGVNFNEQQSEQVKRMVESGRQLDAQKYILRELNKEFEGSAEAQATSSQRIKVAFDNLFESIGKSFAPAVEKALDGLAKFADDASTILNRKDLTASEKFDRIGDEIAERIEAALPVIAEAAGKIAPKIAGAFVRGFIQAPQLVQLVAGAWVFAKARKLLAAFGLLGKQAGAAFSAGAASTTAVGALPAAAGAAGGAALGGAAAGATAGAAARHTRVLKERFGPEARSGAPVSQLGARGGAGAIAGLAGQMKGFVKTAGFAAVGLAIADTVLNAAELQMDRRSSDLKKRLEGLSKTPEISFLNDLPGGGPLAAGAEAAGLEDKSAKRAQRLRQVLDEVAKSHVGITAATLEEGRALARNLDLTVQQRGEINKTLRAGRAESPLAGAGKKAVVEFTRGLASGKKDVSSTVTDLLTGLDGLDVGAQRKASRFALNWAAGLRQTGHLSRKEFRVIKGIIENNLGEIGGISVGGPRKLLRRMGFTFDEMVEAVRHPTSQMGQIVANALEALGEGQAAKNIRTRVTANQLQRSGRGPAAKQIRLPKAKGGFLGGRGLKDTVPIMAAPGEAVLNRHQQRPVETALRQTYGYGLGDLFKRERRPHYFATGGFVSRRRHEDEDTYSSSRTETTRKLASVVEKATRLPSTKPDEGSPRGVPSEGLGRRGIAQVGESVAPLVVQKVSRAFSGTSPELPSLVQRVAFARGGRVGRKKSGIVPIPGQPGESIHSSILGDVMALIRRYKLQITDGYAPSGHAAGGEHPKGLAIDAVPGRGGSWELIDKLAKWAEPKQGSPRAPFRWVGYNQDAGHGRGNHLHLSWGGGGGGVGAGVDVPKLPRVKVEGGTRVTRGLAQAGVDKVRAAAQSLLDKQAGASGAPVGTSSDPGLDRRGGKGGSPAANRRLGRTLMRRFWPDKEWPALARLWQGESGWDEGAVNPSSGAGGIPQALPASKMGKGWQGDARQQINWGLRYIKGRYGSPSKALAAWKARSPHWYARGGFVEDAQQMVWPADEFRFGGSVTATLGSRKPRRRRRPPVRPRGRKLVPDVIGRAPKRQRRPTLFSPGLPGMEKHVPAIRKAIKRNKPKNLTGAYAETRGRSEHATVKRVQGPALSTKLARRILGGEGLLGRVGPKQPKWAEKIQRSMPYQAAMMLGPPSGVAAQVGARVLQKGTKRVGTVTEVRGGSRRVQWDDGSSVLHRKETLVAQRGARAVPAASIPKVTWKKGEYGRGMVDSKGRVHIWPEESLVHDAYGRKHRLAVRNRFYVDREGGVSFPQSDSLSPTVIRKILRADRRLRDLGSIPSTGLRGPEWDAMKRASGRRTHPSIAEMMGSARRGAERKRKPRKFAKGGILRRTALALVGEQGPELAKLPDGIHTLLGREGPEIRELPVRTRVFSHPETKRKAKDIGIQAFARGGTVRDVHDTLSKRLVERFGLDRAEAEHLSRSTIERDAKYRTVRDHTDERRSSFAQTARDLVSRVSERSIRSLLADSTSRERYDSKRSGLLTDVRRSVFDLATRTSRRSDERDVSDSRVTRRSVDRKLASVVEKATRVLPGLGAEPQMVPVSKAFVAQQQIPKATGDTHPPFATNAQFVSHGLSLPTLSLATGGTVRSLVTNRRSTDEQDTRRSSSRRFSSIFERFAKRTGIQAFAKGGFVRPDDDERDFRKKTGGTKPKGLKIPPGGPPPGKGVKWDATAHKWVRRKRKPKVGQLDFLKPLTTALETTIPSITDLIQSKQDTFDLTDEEFYPDERVIPRLQRERHNIQTIKDGSSKSFIDWSAVEQRKSEISQVLAESFRLIGSPFGAPAGVMETVKGLFGSFDVRISDLIAQLKKDIAELRRQVRENLRKLHRNDKRIETLDERIEKEQGKKKPDRSKIRGWREDKGELVEENKELRRANRRLTGESDPTGDLPSGVERTTLKGELGVRQNRLADADEAYEEFKGDRNDFVGASGIGGAFASQRNNIQQLVSDLSTLTTERISESVAPIGPTADEQKADQRAFLAAIGDLTKNFGPNFRRLSGFQRGGMIAGLGSGDKIPVLAEPGEGFINRRAVMALGGPAAIERINKIVPRFQTGGVVASPIQVTAPKGSQQMVVVKDAKPERQRPEKIVLHEYNGPVTQVQDDDPHVGSRYWAKELAAAI